MWKKNLKFLSCDDISSSFYGLLDVENVAFLASTSGATTQLHTTSVRCSNGRLNTQRLYERNGKLLIVLDIRKNMRVAKR